MLYINYSSITNQEAIRQAYDKLGGLGLLAKIQGRFPGGPLLYTKDEYVSFIISHRLWYVLFVPRITIISNGNPGNSRMVLTSKCFQHARDNYRFFNCISFVEIVALTYAG
jgi:hypothetical protein